MTETLESLGKELADRFTVDREIGRGGMAVVYLAHDDKLNRPVAIKVMRPELAASIGAERFLREIEIAAKLTHPNILTLFDCGEADGNLYYVMPFVDGGSLRNRLVANQTLPIDAVLAIARPVAAALNHAHKNGVVHRDVKPENILFSEGQAVVADFGIAKAVSVAGEQGLTKSGFPLGTPGYMSPEQAGGKGQLDERTDVCGLTSVLYEMLVGGTAGVWATPEEVRLGRFFDVMPEHRETLDVLPGRVEQVLVKGLAIRPQQRYETPIELVDDLANAAASTTRLSDAEVRAILNRAAADMASNPTLDETNSLTLGRVEQVAAEAGIRPERVRAAVEKVREHPPSLRPKPRFRIQPNSKFEHGRIVVERTIPGEISPKAYELMVHEINTRLGFVGTISTVGTSLHWAGTKPGFVGRDVRVSLTTASGQTRVHIEEHIELRGASVFAPGWGVAAGVVASLTISAFLGLSDSSLLMLALPLGVAGAAATAIGVPHGLAARYQPQLDDLARRLEKIAVRELTDGT